MSPDWLIQIDDSRVLLLIHASPEYYARCHERFVATNVKCWHSTNSRHVDKASEISGSYELFLGFHTKRVCSISSDQWKFMLIERLKVHYTNKYRWFRCDTFRERKHSDARLESVHYLVRQKGGIRRVQAVTTSVKPMFPRLTCCFHLLKTLIMLRVEPSAAMLWDAPLSWFSHLLRSDEKSAVNITVDLRSSEEDQKPDGQTGLKMTHNYWAGYPPHKKCQPQPLKSRLWKKDYGELKNCHSHCY